MRNADLARNTIATHLRVIRTFLNLCQREGTDDAEGDTLGDATPDARVAVDAAVVATLNHDPDLQKRANLIPSRILIDKEVFIR